MLRTSDTDEKITEIEKKLKLNQLENELKLQTNKNHNEKIITVISCLGTFFFALLSVTCYFTKIGAEPNLSALYGIVSGGITSYLILLSIGKIKEFSFKGGSLEISAKLNEEISSIKGEVKESKKEIEGVNRQLQQIQNLVLTSISNKIHIGDIIHNARRKDDETFHKLKEIGISETESQIKISSEQRQKINSAINESEAYDKIVKDITGKSLTTPVEKLLRANYFSSIHYYDKAIELYDELLHDRYKNAAVLSNKAMALYNLGNIENAISHLEEADKINPTLGAVKNNLALCYSAKGDYSNARRYYEEALKLSPNARTKANLAVTYYYENDIDRFSKILEEAYQMDPSEEIALLWKSEYEIIKDKYDEAIKQADSIIVRGEGEFTLSAKSSKGLALVLKGEHDSGLKLLHEVLEKDPSGTIGLYHMARAQASLKNRELALFYLRKAIVLKPSRKIRARVDTRFDFLKDDEEFKKITEI